MLKVDKILIIMLSIAILIINIQTGSPLEDKNYFLFAILGIMAIGTLLYNRKLIQIKGIDIVVFLFVLSSCIPLITGNYTSLTDTINNILVYGSILAIYTMVRILVEKEERNKDIFIIAILIAAVLQVLYSLDVLTYEIIEKFFHITYRNWLQLTDIRMAGVFTYPNAFAILISACIFLCIEKQISEKTKSKTGIYQAVLFILFVGFVLSYSRTVWILMMAFLLLYILLIRDKRKAIKIISNTVIAGIFTMLYTNLFMKAVVNGEFLIIWTTFIAFVTISFIIGILKKKWEENLSSVKIIVPSLLIIGVLAGILFQVPGELVLFKNKEAMTEVRRILFVEENKEYLLDFEVTAQTKNDIKNVFEIKVVQIDEYGEKVQEDAIQFGTYQGKKEIKINTKEQVVGLQIYFSCYHIRFADKFVIHHMKVNGKENILEYQYIPMDLVTRVKNINLKTKSVNERKSILFDSLKLIAKEPIWGMGGNAWKYRYQEVKTYPYNTTETHSYLTKVFLENGILGFILCFIIVGIVLIKSILYLRKNRDDFYLSILCFIGIIMIQSIVDFGLSFYSILMNLFIGIAILASFWEKEKKKRFTKIGLILIIISIFSMSIISTGKGIAKVISKKVITSYEERIKQFDWCWYVSAKDSEYLIKKIKFMKNYDNAISVIQEIEKLKETEPYYQDKYVKSYEEEEKEEE